MSPLKPTQSPQKPTNMPSESPTTMPTSMPSVAPTTCDERLTQVQTECTASITALQNQTQTLINDISGLTSCATLHETVEHLNGLLEAQTASSWQKAVTSGLSCSAVPMPICIEGGVQECQELERGAKQNKCIEKNPSRPTPEVNNCADDTQAWIDAVTNGHITCMFVPQDVCASVTGRCEVSGSNCIPL